MRAQELIQEVRSRVERCSDPARLADVAARTFRGHVEQLHEERRRERLARLAVKWGARLVVSGRVVKEGELR